MYTIAPIHFLVLPELEPGALRFGTAAPDVPGDGGGIPGGGGEPSPTPVQSDPR